MNCSTLTFIQLSQTGMFTVRCDFFRTANIPAHVVEFCADIEDMQDEIRNIAVNNFMVVG